MALVGATVLVVSCGTPSVVAPAESDGELHVIVTPYADGGPPDGVEVGCLNGPYNFPASALEQIRSYDPVEFPEVDAEFREFLGTGEGQSWPQDNWQILHKSQDEFQIAHFEPQTDSLAFMEALWTDGEWKWSGASIQSNEDCLLYVALPEGLNRVDWRLSPGSQPPNNETTEITVLVTERACAGGKEVGDRLLGPEIVVTDSDVLIAFAAKTQPGFQECPGNPETAVVIKLPEPLGDRELGDGLALSSTLGDYLD